MDRYRGPGAISCEENARAGVLLVNLGTPRAPTPRAVRHYLAEFLNDPRVIDWPAPLRRILVHGVVLRIRPRSSARAYRDIWRDEGSPLLHYSRSLADKLRGALERRTRPPALVALAMRYGEPGIAAGLRGLVAAGATRLVVLPLYPQYSGTTTGSAFDALARELSAISRVPTLCFVGGYYNDRTYIAAVAQSVREAWSSRGRPERLLFSFHGLPQTSIGRGDPYYAQCQESARLVAQALELAPEDWSVAFQSRFGRGRWLEPATDATLLEWARAGVASVTVVCPGFAVDCLETLEEVALRYRRLFVSAGNGQFDYVPALNDTEEHVAMLAGIVMREMRACPEVVASGFASQGGVGSHAPGLA